MASIDFVAVSASAPYVTSMIYILAALPNKLWADFFAIGMQKKRRMVKFETTIGWDDLASDGLAKSKKLSDLLNLRKMDTGAKMTKKEETLEIMKHVVRDIEVDPTLRRDKKIAVASEVRLLAKDDTEARIMLALLGANPPLVCMIDDSPIEEAHIASLYALFNFRIGNNANKAAIVKAGAAHKMLKLIDSSKPPNQAISEAILANFLGLSALDTNKPINCSSDAIISSSGATIFHLENLKYFEETSRSKAREDALWALYTSQSITKTFHSFFYLEHTGDMEVSERILSILSNVVSVSEGRKVIGEAVEAFPILVDVLNWNDSQKCKRKAIYIRMLMAHKGNGDRKVIIVAGIESSLLELCYI